MVFPNFQRLFKLIYDFTKKSRSFIWTKFDQEAFEKINSKLLKPPVLHLQDNRGRFQLFSDTCRTAAGSAIYWTQNGTPKLIGYSNKRLPPAAANYSITGLQLLGLCVNIGQFIHFLVKVYHECTVDHVALTHMKSETGLSSTRIKIVP